PNQFFVPDKCIFFMVEFRSADISRYAAGLSPNFCNRSATHDRPPMGAARITGSPGKYASLASKSEWSSVSGSAQPYALRNRAILSFKSLTASTTISMPPSPEPWVLVEGTTRQLRGVRSWMRKGSRAPGTPVPTLAASHKIAIPSGFLRLPGVGPSTAIPTDLSLTTSVSMSLGSTAQAHGPALPAINLPQPWPSPAAPLWGAINSRYDPSSNPRSAIWVPPVA